MLLFVTKMQKEDFLLYREHLQPEKYIEDTLWFAEELLLDETTLQGFIKAMRALGSLEEHYFITLFGSCVYSTYLLSDDVIYDCLKHQFDPDNQWDIIKISTVRPEAELDIRHFLAERNLDYEVLVL